MKLLRHSVFPVLLLILLACPRTALAQGGEATFRPYWSYETGADVRQIQVADIDGDGFREVVAGTEDNWVYALRPGGELSWRHETDGTITALLAVDFDPDLGAQVIAATATGSVNSILPDGKLGWQFRLPASARALRTLRSDDGPPRRVLAAAEDGTVLALSQTGSLLWAFQTGSQVFDLWAGDLRGDGLVKVVPLVQGGHDIYVLREDGKLDTHIQVDAEIAAVRVGRLVLGKPQQILILTTNWQLLVLDTDGQEMWRQPVLPAGIHNAYGQPLANQMALWDIDNTGTAEVMVLASAVKGSDETRPRLTLYAFKRGRPDPVDGSSPYLWQRELGPGSRTATLATGDANADHKAELMVTGSPDDPVYVLTDNFGGPAKYPVVNNSGALAYGDLNSGGMGELLVGTMTGLHAYGTSNFVRWWQLWQSAQVGRVDAMGYADLNGDGRHMVVAGTYDGYVVAFGHAGQILWDVELEDAIVALAAGSFDGNGRDSVLVATGSRTTDADGQVYLLRDGREVWTTSAGGSVVGLVVRPRPVVDNPAAEPVAPPEIVAGIQTPAGGALIGLDSHGALLWHQELPGSLTAIRATQEDVLVRLADGRVYTAGPGGALTEEPSLQNQAGFGLSKVIFGSQQATESPTDSAAGLHAARSMQVLNRLADNEADPAEHNLPEIREEPGASERSLVGPAFTAQVGQNAIVRVTGREVALFVDEHVVWKGLVEGEPRTIEAVDLDGDGQLALAVGTNQGRVHVYGVEADQPALLTDLAVVAGHGAYHYSVEVNDPCEESVTVTLQILQPSTGAWLPQPPQLLNSGKGRLAWQVNENIFTTWDAEQDSAFRFSFDDGEVRGLTLPATGPLNIPTTPPLRLFGTYIGATLLLAAVGTLGTLSFVRRRAALKSPLGRAQSTVARARLRPERAFDEIHALTSAGDEGRAVLAYIPGSAREAGLEWLSALADSYNLLLARSELMVEGLRSIVDALSAAPSPTPYRTQLLTVYTTVHCAMMCQATEHVASLRDQLTAVQVLADLPGFPLKAMALCLGELLPIAQAFGREQQVDGFEDKTRYLALAIEGLGYSARPLPDNVGEVERIILRSVMERWTTIAADALRALQGRAQLVSSLVTRHVVATDNVTLVLEVTNIGRSQATKVAVDLLPGEGYVVLSGHVALDALAPGRPAQLRFAVRPTGEEQLRTSFVVRFGDVERSDKSQTIEAPVRLLPVPLTFARIPNPYTPGIPLRHNSSVYFGRDDLFTGIHASMVGGDGERILVLTGERRMGKTSFLQQLPDRLGQDCVTVYLDMQSLAIDPGIANFLYDVASRIAEAVGLPPPAYESLRARPTLAFEREFLPLALAAAGSRRLLLLLDEFEELEMRVTSGNLAPEIFPFLRHVMQHVSQLAFIFVGTHRLEDLTASYWSAFFNVALHRRIGRLDESAARALICKPIADWLFYDDLAVDKMLRSTGGHPYFLQLLCHTIIRQANQAERNYVMLSHVRQAYEPVLSLGEAHFVFLWDQLSDTEKQIARGLALQSVTGVSGEAEDLAERVPAAERERALNALVVREVLRSGPRQGQHEFVVDLLRLWIVHRFDFGASGYDGFTDGLT